MTGSTAPSVLFGLSALVTGASSGIGAALATALGRAGARLLLTGRDAARLAEVAAATRDAGAFAVATMAADLTADEDLASLAERTGQTFAGLDLLVQSAGALYWGRIEAMPKAALDHLLALNVRAPFLLTQLLLPHLRAARGRVVFVNSQAVVRRPAAGLAGYTATKSALRALADTLREEVATDGVRVLSVFPGRTATPMQRELRRLEGETYEPEGLLQPEDVAAAVLDSLALPARAEITELFLRPRP